MKPQDKAQALFDALIWDERHDGEKFVRLTGDHELWMRNLVREIHDGMMPDDTKYLMIREVAGRLADIDPEHWDDWRWETIDGLVDIYNHARIGWLASHLDRAWYVNEALAEYGGKDIFQILGQGQFREYEEIYDYLVEAFTAEEEVEHE